MNTQIPPPLELVLNEQEKALRELFVSEYLKDFNEINAALRCGFAIAFAIQWGPVLLKETYVQRRLAELTRKPGALNQSDQDKEDRALVENTLRRNMQTGTGAVQVTAAKAFNELKGWTKHDDSADAAEALAELFKGFAQKVPV